jgi:putative colanic acid biosynthesis UDP-glucose lipid carrier transferase
LLAELAGFLHAKGHNRQRIIIITDGCSGGEVAENLQENDFLGMEIVGFVTLDADMSKVCSPIKSKWQILGYLKNLEQLVSDHQIHQVWITLPITKLGKLQEIKNSLILTPVCVHMVVDNLGFSIFRQSTSTLGNTPVINLVMSPLERSVNQIMKNSLDKFIAGLLIILIAPFMLLIAISIYMTSRGPILFRQKRVTKNGQIFEMIKFRSMIVDADGKEPVWGDARNKRVTKLGLLLRQSSLDELPQLFNVLIGDMSIVGPRPERPEFVEKFKHEIPGYNHKHLIKAGITGWAQINGWRGDTDLRKRIEHDIYYIENWSLWLDLRIIFMTIFTGMVSKYAY